MVKRLIPGTWARSYSPGVWQVCRVLRGFNELRYSLADRKVRSRRVLVITKRLVSAQWKRAFAAECCDASFVTPLTKTDRIRVERLLSANPRLAAAFGAYQPVAPDLIVNLSMAISPARLKSFCKSVLSAKLRRGLDHDGVLRLLERAGLAQFIGATPIGATLQLVCRDHELSGAEFIFRDCQVLAF